MSDRYAEEVSECDCNEVTDELDIDVMTSKLRTKGVKRRKQVLSEDLYVDQIETIIERDFFPDLVQFRHQLLFKPTFGVERQQPLSSRQSPTTFETPIRLNDSNVDEIEDKVSDNINHKSLDQFLNKYTSEDNASFEQIQEQEIRRHRLKYEWLYKDVNKNNNKVKELLELPSIERQAIDDRPNDGSVVTWNYTNKNSVMYNPSGIALNDQILNTKRQEVIHENTRFKTMPFNESVNQMTIALAAQLNARQNEGKIGIDGKELVTRDTPQINGFKFVASTPTPAPELCSESPFMTWGEIEGTPFSLTGTDTPLHPSLTPGSSHFKIPELPQREKLGLSLATKTAKQYRDRKKKAMNCVQTSLSLQSPTLSSFKTSLERLNSMSPAAQKLAKTKLGIHMHRDHTLLASYSPARTPSTPKSSVSDSPLTPIQTQIHCKKRK